MKKIGSLLRHFIEDNIELIESTRKEDWQTLYDKFEDHDGDDLAGSFGALMLDMDNDPSIILGYIPRRFLQYQHDITSYKIQDGMQYISMSAFEDTNLKEIIIPNSVKELDYVCFGGTDLEQVIIPESVVRIDNAAFHSCKKLKSILLTNVKELGEDVFGDCIHLTDVTINKDVDQIDANCFDGCTRLKQINYLGTKLDFATRSYGSPEHNIIVVCSDGDYVWFSDDWDVED